ncbi:MAG: GNAT family N-acetyltransferase [Acidimicrobiia bacterium]|nr:GNAT family N-acetyltransferase [Acidimicrobiia bacterium]
MAKIEVVKVDGEDRFEARIDGNVVGTAYYRRHPSGRIFFTHTEVDDNYQGKGVGATLAGGALDIVRTQGDRVVPLCPFMAGFIERNETYQDLVDPELTQRFTQSRGGS